MTRRFSGWVLVTACIGLLTLMAGLIAVGRHMTLASVPAFLDGRHPTVAALASARTERQLLFGLQQRYRARQNDREELWSTQQVYRGPASVDLWADDRAIVLVNHSPWQVPPDPDWSEDPYGDLSWQSQYHSLGWL